MKFDVNLPIPMSCPNVLCGHDDFHVLLSHPFGDNSKTGMWVECPKCKERFYTGPNLVVIPELRELYNKLEIAIATYRAREKAK